MRKTFGIFTDHTATVVNVEELGSGVMAITFEDGQGGKALVVINPHNTGLPYTLEGEWNLVADGTRAGGSVLEKQSGGVTVEGITIRVYVNDALVK